MAWDATAQKEILRVAQSLGIDPNHLAAVISFETGGTFNTNARNPNSSGTGLIQFMQYTDGTGDRNTPRSKWDWFGMNRDQFGGLPFGTQMDYVERYLRGRGIKPGATLAQIYQSVAGSGYKTGSDAYNLNPSWDSNKDGVISAGEQILGPQFQAHVKNYYGPGATPKAANPGAKWVPPTAKEIADAAAAGRPLAPYLVADAATGKRTEAQNPGLQTMTEAEAQASSPSAAEKFLGFQFSTLKGAGVSIVGGLVALVLLIAGVVLLGMSWGGDGEGGSTPKTVPIPI